MMRVVVNGLTALRKSLQNKCVEMSKMTLKSAVIHALLFFSSIILTFLDVFFSFSIFQDKTVHTDVQLE